MNMKKFICCFSCIALITISIIYSGRLLQPNFTIDALNAIDAFHDMPENSIDVIACGSSHVWKGFNAQTITDKYNLNTYNYGCNWQFFNTTSLFFQDALRSQTPKVVLIETYNVDKIHQDEDLNGEIYYTRAISDFPGKRQYLKQCFGDNKDRYLSYYIPLLAFHENWANINMYSFDPGTSTEEFIASRGFSGHDNITPVTISAPGTFEQKELPESSVEILDNMVNICHEKNIELIFYTVPYEGEYNYSNALSKYASANNCTYIDFFKLMDETGLDCETDFMDFEHLNTNGATKIADYLGEYITTHYSIKTTGYKD